MFQTPQAEALVVRDQSAGDALGIRQVGWLGDGVATSSPAGCPGYAEHTAEVGHGNSNRQQAISMTNISFCIHSIANIIFISDIRCQVTNTYTCVASICILANQPLSFGPLRLKHTGFVPNFTSYVVFCETLLSEFVC